MDRRLRSDNGLLSSLIVRRLIAAYIDLLVTALPCGAIAFAVRLFFGKTDIDGALILSLPLMVLCPVCFFLRDLLRPSPGKRLMGLRIVNADGTEDVPAKRLIFRHLTIGLWPVELYSLIRSGGESRWGDRLMEIKLIRV